jgi:hypothetical protein
MRPTTPELIPCKTCRRELTGLRVPDRSVDAARLAKDVEEDVVHGRCPVSPTVALRLPIAAEFTLKCAEIASTHIHLSSIDDAREGLRVVGGGQDGFATVRAGIKGAQKPLTLIGGADDQGVHHLLGGEALQEEVGEEQQQVNVSLVFDCDVEHSSEVLQSMAPWLESSSWRGASLLNISCIEICDGGRERVASAASLCPLILHPGDSNQAQESVQGVHKAAVEALMSVRPSIALFLSGHESERELRLAAARVAPTQV